MFPESVAARIRELAPGDAVEQENVLQEIVQQYILASLSRAGLFTEAIFHGGTCLRIVHAINRFSQDLDFLLKNPDIAVISTSRGWPRSRSSRCLRDSQPGPMRSCAAPIPRAGTGMT